MNLLELAPLGKTPGQINKSIVFRCLEYYITALRYVILKYPYNRCCGRAKFIRRAESNNHIYLVTKNRIARIWIKNEQS